jgi:hypothetical protein
LKEYTLASANNEPTDRNDVLGPPASLYDYPFNEIQALWQVNAASAALGIAHVSNLIDDNTKSKINAQIVDWIYEGSYQSVSLLAVDHVQLNGNALLSVLRNRCGQSELSYEGDESHYAEDTAKDNEKNDNMALCGSKIAKPKLQGKPMSTLSFFVTVCVFVAFAIWIAILLENYRRYFNHQEQVKRLEKDIHEMKMMMYHQCGNGE